MRNAAVTPHALDQDVFQTARALHARVHALPWSSVIDVLALVVSEDVTLLSAGSLLGCRCCTGLSDSSGCHQLRNFSCGRMPFGLALYLSRIAEDD